MNMRQLRLTAVEETCCLVGCEEPSTWVVWPGPTFHCEEHIKPYFTYEHWKKWRESGDAKIVKLWDR